MKEPVRGGVLDAGEVTGGGGRSGEVNESPKPSGENDGDY